MNQDKQENEYFLDKYHILFYGNSISEEFVSLVLDAIKEEMRYIARKVKNVVRKSKRRI